MYVLSGIAGHDANCCYTSHIRNAFQPLLPQMFPFVRHWVCLCLTEILTCCDLQTRTPKLLLSCLANTSSTLPKSDPIADIRVAFISTFASIVNGILRHSSSFSNAKHRTICPQVLHTLAEKAISSIPLTLQYCHFEHQYRYNAPRLLILLI